MAKQIKTVSDLIPDSANANKGTERGRYAVEASLRETGAGRSIVVDKEGRIIAGNKTLEAWADISGEIEIVKTDGKKLIVVQREDLDLSDVEGLARKLAYYDNRASEVGLAWDAEQVVADLQAGVDLSAMFFEDEIDAITNVLDSIGVIGFQPMENESREASVWNKMGSEAKFRKFEFGEFRLLIPASIHDALWEYAGDIEDKTTAIAEVIEKGLLHVKNLTD